jgi:hypothetical protein
MASERSKTMEMIEHIQNSYSSILLPGQGPVEEIFRKKWKFVVITNRSIQIALLDSLQMRISLV